jgi:hypothetical protein
MTQPGVVVWPGNPLPDNEAQLGDSKGRTTLCNDDEKVGYARSSGAA